MLDLVVSGRFALPGGRLAEGEIGIADGRIAVLAGPGELRGEERIDVPADQLILPGHVDAHVHTGSAPGEGVERTTRSAAAGGVTTIIDMPYDDPEPANSLARFEAEGRARRGRGRRRRRPLCDRRTERRARRDRAAARGRRRRLQGLDVRDPPGALPARAGRRAAAGDGDLRGARRARLLPPRERRHRAAAARAARGGGPQRSDGARRRPAARRGDGGDRRARSSSAARRAAGRTSATSRSSAASRSSATR